MDEPKLIHSFPKNPMEEIRACITNYKGRHYVDLRVFYRDDAGDFMPTKKGITLNVDLAGELLDAVTKLAAAVEDLR